MVMLQNLSHGYEQREEVRSHSRHALNMQVTRLQNQMALALERDDTNGYRSAHAQLKELEKQL